jgi:hypothetical protein
MQDAATTLRQLYAARDNILAGKVATYSVGDRSITLLDLNTVEQLIEKYENVVAAGVPVIADLSGA